MANKMTKKEVVTMMLADEAIKGNETYVSYLENELRLLSKKRSSKNSKKQEENEAIKGLILEVLGDADAPMTVTELLATGRFADGTTNQKLTALLRQLVLAEKVEKTVEKKVSRFAVA